MLSDCFKRGHGFGVVAIREGREVGRAAHFYPFGTLAEIIDFDRQDDGVLGITCRGGATLRVLSHTVRPDQLAVGRIEFLPEEPQFALPDDYTVLSRLLRRLLEREEFREYAQQLDFDMGNATWVGCRLAELLPMPLAAKQQLLELRDATQRLADVYAALQQQP
jgi:Lon protease-like protein